MSRGLRAVWRTQPEWWTVRVKGLRAGACLAVLAGLAACSASPSATSAPSGMSASASPAVLPTAVSIVSPVTDGTVVIGRGRTPASRMMAQFYATALQQAGRQVAFTVSANPSSLVDALDNQAITVAPQMVGPLVGILGGEKPANDSSPVSAASDGQALLASARKAGETRGMDVLNPSPADVRPVFMVTRAFSERTGVTTLADLSSWGRDHPVRLGGPPGCDVTDWCLPSLVAAAILA
jgi:glycine betaine/choline ABC-type transport system substrate-binding protein